MKLHCRIPFLKNFNREKLILRLTPWNIDMKMNKNSYYGKKSIYYKAS